MQKRCLSGRDGFTLVELLIVIAIITVLAALLLPTLKTAVEKARAVSCLSNYQQCGVGVLQYASDFGGWLMCYDSSGGGLSKPYGAYRPQRYWTLSLRCNGYLPDNVFTNLWDDSTFSPPVTWRGEYRTRKVVTICPSASFQQRLYVDRWDNGVRRGRWYGSESSIKRSINMATVRMDLPYLADTCNPVGDGGKPQSHIHFDTSQAQLHARHVGRLNAWMPGGGARGFSPEELLMLDPSRLDEWKCRVD